MERGWDATGRLRPLWGKVGGRDRLADLTGINATVLSSYNSGKRQLGEKNAKRIAKALKVSLLELGAPDGLKDRRGESLHAHLEAISETLADLGEQGTNRDRAIHRLDRRLRDLQLRVEELESAVHPRRRKGAAK